MTGIERVFLAGDLVAPPAVNQLVLEGQGDVAPDAWAAAWSATTVSWPGTRLVWRGWLGGSRWDVGGAAPGFRVEDADWDGSGPEGAPFLCARMDPRGGPLAELVIVRDPRGGSRVVLRTHHAILDGRATLDLARDLFRMLRGETPRGACAGPTTAEDLVTGARPLPPPPADCPSPLGPAADLVSTWRRRRIAGGTQHRLLPRVLVALARVAAETGGGIRVAIPVDLRQFHPELPPLSANLTSLLRLPLRAHLSESDPVDALDRDLRARLAAREDAATVAGWRGLRGVPVSWLGAVGRWGARRNVRRDRHAVTAVVSNLGRVSASEVSGGGFTAKTAFFLPTPSPGIPLVLMLLGGDDGVEVTGLGAAEHAERIGAVLHRVCVECG